MDKNGQPRFVGKQNHPRVVTEPIRCLWYAGNSDTQFMLINATPLKTWISFGRSVEKYTKFANNLVTAGCGGLEHHNGALLVVCYLSGYQCKGDVTSAAWEVVSRSLTDDYCNKDGNADKTIRSLITK
jgi:hypothetical protein